MYKYSFAALILDCEQSTHYRYERKAQMDLVNGFP